MAKTVASREFRANLAALLAELAQRREHVVVTRNGRPAAALVPIDEYEALEEPPTCSPTRAPSRRSRRVWRRSRTGTRCRLMMSPLSCSSSSAPLVVARAVLSRRARRELLGLDRPVADAIVEAIRLLEREPSTGHELRGRLVGLRSLRVGAYRVIYQGAFLGVRWTSGRLKGGHTA